MPIKHPFVSAKPDGGDAALLQPSSWNADHTVDAVAPSGLTGATAATRYVGGSVSGAPTTGTFAVGDYVVAQDGFVHICTVAGSPGEWAAAGGTGNADKIWVPGSNPYGLDDEFNDASIDASWILVNPSPVRATWTEGADVLSCYVAPGNAVGQYNAIMKSLGGRSYPITIESAMRYLTPYAYNYLMLGILFANGVTWGSGVNIGSEQYTENNLAVSGRFSLHEQPTAYNSDGARNGQVALQWTGSVVYHKVIWSAANTFSFYASPDGVSWITVYQGKSFTLTPTHVGLDTSGWAGGSACIGSFEYFRVY